MKYRIAVALLLLGILIISVSCAELNSIQADLYFDEVDAMLSANKELSIYIEAKNIEPHIGVDYCKLEQRIGNTWVFVKNLPKPTYVVDNTNTYNVTKNYSGEISNTGTYRIEVRVYAGIHYKTVYSTVGTY